MRLDWHGLDVFRVHPVDINIDWDSGQFTLIVFRVCKLTYAAPRACRAMSENPYFPLCIQYSKIRSLSEFQMAKCYFGQGLCCGVWTEGDAETGLYIDLLRARPPFIYSYKLYCTINADLTSGSTGPNTTERLPRNQLIQRSVTCWGPITTSILVTSGHLKPSHMPCRYFLAKTPISSPCSADLRRSICICRPAQANLHRSKVEHTQGIYA
jgi:hypothetical protein